MANANGNAIHLKIPASDMTLVINNLRFAKKMLELANNQLDPMIRDPELQRALVLLISQAKNVIDDAVVMGSSPCSLEDI
jgi:hypothetical protein